MTIPSISQLPPAPSRADDNETFVLKADAFLAALQTMVTELNLFATALAAETAATNYNTSSSTAVTIATGTQNFTAETGKLLQPGQFITIASEADPSNYMFGQVLSYDDQTGALSVDVQDTGGSGEFDDWIIALAPYSGAFLQLAGGTISGALTVAGQLTAQALLLTTASAAGGAGLRLPHGAAPSSPTNGDVWTTSGGIFCRVNGATYQLASLAGTETLTNKRVNPRVVSAGTTSGTITPAGDTADLYIAAGLDGAITLAAPSGTPVHGQKLMLRIKDNGSSRGITWDDIYRVMGPIALPASTTAGKTHYFGLIYNATDTKWDVVGMVTEP